MLNDNAKLDAVLLELGHDDRVCGTEYIRTGVRTYYPGCKMEWLYATVAEVQDTTASAAERAMRHSLEKAWNRADYGTIAGYFGASWDGERGRPTVGEYLARLDRLTRAAHED